MPWFRPVSCRSSATRCSSRRGKTARRWLRRSSPNYQADTVEATEKALSAFENSPWRQRFPTIAQSWRRHWEHIIPLFPFAAPVRKIIWLALRNITAKWENPPIAWATAKAQFAIKFDERFRFDD